MEYSGERNDIGSILCLSIVSRLPKTAVEVIDATQIHPRERPAWLYGTPTLRYSDGTVFRGSEAYDNLLNHLCSMMTDEKKPPKATTQPIPDNDESAFQPVEISEDAENTGRNGKMSSEDFAMALRNIRRDPPQGKEPPPLEVMKD